MTVEQPALPRVGQSKQPDDQTYAQVKEVTGITDRKKIDEAINVCRNNDGKYDISDVVDVLISGSTKKHEKTTAKEMAITYPKDNKDAVDAVAGPGQNVNKNSKGVIDLTNVSDTNESEDIQKAIAASLADSGGPYTQESTSGAGILGGQVSREEQDISRVLEQSLIESKAGTKRKRGDIWFVDPLNPHERKRHENWPIGLKNVGNTCWFSAVIQSLFHLRRFRHLVLTYHPNTDVQGTSEVKRNLRFMQELRHLFALMVGSRRKYVDPSKAVDILKEAFSTSVVSNTSVSDSQQDVSEFQHKLLDWLEDAFKSVSRPNSPEEGKEKTDAERRACNPMVDLFYGQYRAEGFNEGKVFTNDETFGQFPLQVNGFRDIHESLEAATALREIETVSSESSQKSGQELWFTHLPPVLTFELSRFQFNQQIGRPEKIHNKIEFPQVIYMDRYMDCNRDETRIRRERAKKLKESLLALQARLEKFTNYGSGAKRFPLQDVLQYALEFAKSGPDTGSRKSVTISPQDVEMECLSPNNSSNMMVDSPIKSPPDVAMATAGTSPTEQSAPDDVANTPTQLFPNKDSTTSASLAIPEVPMVTSASNTPPDVTMATESRSSPVAMEVSGDGPPQPKHVSDVELVVLQDCLHRWRTEVENDVKELQDRISGLEDSISKMYSDDSMTKHPYNLHAVLVHEGQAASGHYWAYIHDAATDQWLKFNDITVSDASWDELEKESVGGYHNASAYCLMYIDKTRVAEVPFSGEPSSNDSGDVDNLPDDMKELVAMDNKLFSEEIEKWDRELSRKAAGAGDAEVTVVAESKPALPMPSMGVTSTVSTQTLVAVESCASVHAHLSTQESLAALKRVLETDVYDKLGEQGALNMAADQEFKRVTNVANNLAETYFPTQDPRLQHIVVYMLHSECNVQIAKILVIEQFAELVVDHTEKIKKLKQTAAEFMKKMKDQMEKDYMHWHETYQTFLKTALLMIRGITLYLDEKHTQALPYILHGHLLSDKLNAKIKNGGICERKLSAFFLRQTLLHINDTATQQFEDKSDVTGTLEEMTKHVLPCLQTVANTGYTEDVTAVEEIREKWCSFLGQEMEANKVAQLQDFLSKLFEPPLDLRLPGMPSLRNERYSQIHIQYAQVMQNVEQYGYLEQALKTT